MKSTMPRSARRTMMVAVVMGAAFVTMPGEKANAAEPSDKTVNDISRYCQACWRNARLPPDSWSDCTQEVMARLLERVEPSRWSVLLKKEEEDHREFLRAIDTVKKRSQRTKGECARDRAISDTLCPRRRGPRGPRYPGQRSGFDDAGRGRFEIVTPPEDLLLDCAFLN